MQRFYWGCTIPDRTVCVSGSEAEKDSDWLQAVGANHLPANICFVFWNSYLKPEDTRSGFAALMLCAFSQFEQLEPEPHSGTGNAIPKTNTSLQQPMSRSKVGLACLIVSGKRIVSTNTFPLTLQQSLGEVPCFPCHYGNVSVTTALKHSY